MHKHLEYKYKQYTIYPCSSNECAIKAHVVNGFVVQVLVYGLALRCTRTDGSSWNGMSWKSSY